ncbi:hypothetical protein C3R30_21545, partial [Mycobacterium tuberculosis]
AVVLRVVPAPLPPRVAPLVLAPGVALLAPRRAPLVAPVPALAPLALLLAAPARWPALLAPLTALPLAFLVGPLAAGVAALPVFASWAGALSPLASRPSV